MKRNLLVLVALVALVACDNAPPQSASAPAQPQALETGTKPAAQPVAAHGAPHAQPTSQPVAAKAASPHGQPTSQPVGARGGSPHGQPTSRPTAGGSLPPGHPPLPAGDVKGSIRLDPSLATGVKPGSVLFIMARREAGEGQKGMLLAVKKVPIADAKAFPIAYTLTQADVMMQGTQLNGVVRVSARLDQDGDALSKIPGDIEGICSSPAPVGTAAVDLTLNKKL